jgi:hypothetical protein
MEIEKALFRNRDENSFTARLFEGYVFPECYNEKDTKSKTFFPDLIQRINNGIDRCGGIIKGKLECNELTEFQSSKIPIDLEFIDGMLFVECVDLFAALGKGSEDKTEFDAIVVAKNNYDEKRILLVFEIKCFSDLQYEEIERQQDRLNELKKLYQDFDYFHVALISEDNLKNAKNIFLKFRDKITDKPIKNLSIISWQDILKDLPENKYILQERIKLSSRSLPKEISKYGDISEPPRNLMSQQETIPRK